MIVLLICKNTTPKRRVNRYGALLCCAFDLTQTILKQVVTNYYRNFVKKITNTR